MIDINKIEGLVKSVSDNKLMPFYRKAQARNKPDGSLITQADIAVQAAIKEQLAIQYPHYAFLAEEMSEAEMALFFSENHTGYWCLDPLDGTSNFAAGLPYFAISLALIIDHQSVFGMIYDPVRDECFTALKGQGAWLNGQLISPTNSVSTLVDCLANVDLKRLPIELTMKLLSEQPYRSQRSFGASALEWCWLATGRCQLYLHGKQMLWDYAAGLLIAQESGCVSCTLNGSAIFEESANSRTVVASVNKSLQNQWNKFIN